jgi:hypothetical protein
MTTVLVGRTERSRVWRVSKVAVQILSAHPWRRPHTGLSQIADSRVSDVSTRQNDVERS